MITTLEHLLLGYLPFWSLLRPALCTAGDPSSEQGWDHLMTIGYGETTTYSAIARALGNPNMAQAVGHSVGHNPISLVVPCHRVVGSEIR